MIRGDSETITVALQDSTGAAVPLVDGDVIYLTVKSDTQTDDKILQKVVTSFTDGKAIIAIVPSDTKHLPAPIELMYDVQLSKADGSVITIVKPSKFVVEGEVTYE
jgi:hypothetical protein